MDNVQNFPGGVTPCYGESAERESRARESMRGESRVVPIFVGKYGQPYGEFF